MKSLTAKNQSFLKVGLGQVCSMVLAMFFSLLSEKAVSQGYDPLIDLNRQVFKFNSAFDKRLAQPIAESYTRNVPRGVRKGVRNFFGNLSEIDTFANNLLQLKLKAAVSDLCRFTVNTTVGIGGIFDPATKLGLQKNQEDFGQTLGHWGVKPGPYLVLPFFGFSGLRDVFGLGASTYLSPVQWQSNDLLTIKLFALNQISIRSNLLALDDLVVIDEYLFTREAYLQRREFLINESAHGGGFEEF